ncbi:MAG TPA: hypothetical protein VM409_08715, partial [Chloroflexia bacterium]|nr:hypothetical protein [Chloroflexia bacterium]
MADNITVEQLTRLLEKLNNDEKAFKDALNQARTTRGPVNEAFLQIESAFQSISRADQINQIQTQLISARDALADGITPNEEFDIRGALDRLPDLRDQLDSSHARIPEWRESKQGVLDLTMLVSAGYRLLDTCREATFALSTIQADVPSDPNPIMFVVSPTGGGGNGHDNGGHGGDDGGGDDNGDDSGDDYPSYEDPNIRDLVRAVENLSIYPNTEQTAGVYGAPSSPALVRSVNTAMQTVIGRVPRASDYKSFLAALRQSFTISEVNGQQVCEWTPRSFIGVADLGSGEGVTGAQASLASFARTALDNSLPLLDGVASLLPDADNDDVDATRAILRMTWSEFVNLLSTEGGPIAARADLAMRTIIGRAPFTRELGQLTRLGLLLGMLKTDSNGKPVLNSVGRPLISRKYVGTPDDEQRLTSYIGFSDYVYSVEQSWRNYRENFFQADFGTGMVLISRALSVVAETVEKEVIPAMDWVRVGEAERLATRIDFANSKLVSKDMTVGELLSWVSTYSSTTASDMIRDGGRWGVEAILPTANLLRVLVRDFVNIL